jgi:hypothetical protein
MNYCPDVADFGAFLGLGNCSCLNWFFCIISTPTKGLKFCNSPPIKGEIFVYEKQFRIKVC